MERVGKLNLMSIFGTRADQERPYISPTILDIQKDIGDGVVDPATNTIRCLDSEQAKLWKSYLKQRDEWEIKCRQGRQLIKESFSTTIWHQVGRELDIDLIEPYPTDVDIRVIIAYIKKEYGGYSAATNERNLAQISELPKFTSLIVAKKCLDDLKALLEERKSWDEFDRRQKLINEYPVPECDLQLWMYRRINTPMFCELIPKSRKKNKSFLEMRSMVDKFMKEKRLIETWDTTPRSVLGKQTETSSIDNVAMSTQQNNTKSGVRENAVAMVRRCFVCNGDHLSPDCEIAKKPGYDGSRPFHPIEAFRAPRNTRPKPISKGYQGKDKIPWQKPRNTEQFQKKPYEGKRPFNSTFKPQKFSVNAAHVLDADEELNNLEQLYEQRMSELKRRRIQELKEALGDEENEEETQELQKPVLKYSNKQDFEIEWDDDEESS
jgi:hypothetical protein